jgi:hypothetical protein
MVAMRRASTGKRRRGGIPLRLNPSTNGTTMKKQVIKVAVPETSGPFNLCVRYGDMIYISGLTPFDESDASQLREARAKGQPIPPFPDIAFERQVRIVMDHMKMLVEAAGSNMDCLLTFQNAETPGRCPGVSFRPIELKSSYCLAGGAGGVGAGFIDGASAGAPAGGAGGSVRWPVVAGGRVVSLAV